MRHSITRKSWPEDLLQNKGEKLSILFFFHKWLFENFYIDHGFVNKRVRCFRHSWHRFNELYFYAPLLFRSMWNLFSLSKIVNKVSTCFQSILVFLWSLCSQYTCPKLCSRTYTGRRKRQASYVVSNVITGKPKITCLIVWRVNLLWRFHCSMKLLQTSSIPEIWREISSYAAWHVIILLRIGKSHNKENIFLKTRFLYTDITSLIHANPSRSFHRIRQQYKRG